MKRRVVVTGIGAVTSLSCDVEDLWKRVLAGESGIHPFRLFEMSDFKVTFGGDIYDFDPSEYLDHREAKRLDRFSQFAMVAGSKAMKDANLDFENSEFDRDRVGVILGSGCGGLREIEAQMERIMTKGPNRVSPMTVPKMMLNAAGGNFAIRYRLKGPNYAVATACASATNAMGNALKTIQAGECDIVVTGGTEAAITRMGLAAFQNIKALSNRIEDPPRASRPFDMDRDGFVFSEGAGLMIFEELEHAKARGAEIYGEVLGYGASCDAGHITQPDEQGRGASKAMDNAVKDAQISPDQIDYINAHGTSTPLGDKAETLAVKNVFGDHAYKLSISSTKSQLGHSLGASGGMELILTLKAICEQVVPPTINLDTPDPDCDLDYTPNVPKEREIGIAMSNSFGFGGHNASVIVGRLRNDHAK